MQKQQSADTNVLIGQYRLSAKWPIISRYQLWADYQCNSIIIRSGTDPGFWIGGALEVCPFTPLLCLPFPSYSFSCLPFLHLLSHLFPSHLCLPLLFPFPSPPPLLSRTAILRTGAFAVYGVLYKIFLVIDSTSYE